MINTPFDDESEHEEIPIISDKLVQDHGDVAAQLNKSFDESDDYLSAEIVSLLNHRYAAGILEFQTEYSNGDKNGILLI